MIDPVNVPPSAASILIETPFGIITASFNAGTVSGLSQFVPVFQLPLVSAVLVAAYALGMSTYETRKIEIRKNEMPTYDL